MADWDTSTTISPVGRDSWSFLGKSVPHLTFLLALPRRQDIEIQFFFFFFHIGERRQGLLCSNVCSQPGGFSLSSWEEVILK